MSSSSPSASTPSAVERDRRAPRGGRASAEASARAASSGTSASSGRGEHEHAERERQRAVAVVGFACSRPRAARAAAPERAQRRARARARTAARALLEASAERGRGSGRAREPRSHGGSSESAVSFAPNAPCVAGERVHERRLARDGVEVVDARDALALVPGDLRGIGARRARRPPQARLRRPRPRAGRLERRGSLRSGRGSSRRAPRAPPRGLRGVRAARRTRSAGSSARGSRGSRSTCGPPLTSSRPTSSPKRSTSGVDAVERACRRAPRSACPPPRRAMPARSSGSRTATTVATVPPAWPTAPRTSASIRSEDPPRNTRPTLRPCEQAVDGERIAGSSANCCSRESRAWSWRRLPARAG